MERVNKLVTVHPVKSRYIGETGDVVVGRIAQVASKRWKLEVNSRQEASLLLSAVDLPGATQSVAQYLCARKPIMHA